MKDLTVRFTNLPDGWTEKDVKEAVTMGMLLKHIQKNPDFLKKIKTNAKELP
jgi:hypothetical protein